MINYLLVFKPKGGENMSYGGSCGFGGGFALLVVLFILLIIVDAAAGAEDTNFN